MLIYKKIYASKLIDAPNRFDEFCEKSFLMSKVLERKSHDKACELTCGSITAVQMDNFEL